MKDIEDIIALVVDYGTFISLAERLSESYKKVYYYTPFEEEYRSVQKCCLGDGLQRVERLDDFMEPTILETIDLVCFPDIGYGGFQRYLRSIGKLVWGSMGASDLELYRTRFISTVNDLGLQVVPSVKIVGITNLANHLQTVENKWVKINRFRAEMETWHHQDYAHSQRILESLSVKFGGLKERAIFVVQDPIEDAREIGYDGFCVDGQYPAQSFSGYEKKNELYLGSLLDNEKLPEPVQVVNEAMSPLLNRYGYRNFIATELRVKDNDVYFIDPTNRMAGQTMEHQYQTCENLPEVILRGAAGELVTPKFAFKYAAEATLHHTAGEPDQWKVLNVPEPLRPWAKFYHFCEADGLLHFPPGRNDEVGVVCGAGDSIEEAFDSLNENFSALDGEPVSIRTDGFAELLEEIKKAEDEGMEFTDKPIPDPSIVLG